MNSVRDPQKIKLQLENICVAHSFFILSALKLSEDPLSIPEITREISRITRGIVNLQDQQARVPTKTLTRRGLLKEVSTYYGRRRITKYDITEEGLRYLNAMKRFLDALEA